MMHRYVLKFAYDGSNYKGYAKQPNEVTIQGTLETILSKIFNEEIIIHASGRTDKGVHALEQVAHFDSTKKKDLDALKNSLNKLLPFDIRIKNIKFKSKNFDSRFSAIKKEYLYVINLKEENPFKYNQELYVKNLNLEKIVEISKVFEGTHSFINFCSKEEDEDNFIRTIFSINIKKRSNYVYISFIGNGFMRYQVRKIMGTMLAYSSNEIKKEEILDYLNTSSNRNIISYTAPSKALYLKKVYY